MIASPLSGRRVRHNRTVKERVDCRFGDTPARQKDHKERVLTACHAPFQAEDYAIAGRGKTVGRYGD